MTESNEMHKEIIEIISEIAEQEPEDVGLDDNLPEKHDVNSLMGLEILVALEKKYKVKIPESKLQEMTTIRKISDLILEAKKVVAASD